jgi:hypothetical protein
VPWRVVTDDHGGAEPWRRCSGRCARWLPESSGAFRERRRGGYEARCLACLREDQRDAWAARPETERRAITRRRRASAEATAEALERRRATNRESARRRRAADPEGYKATQRRYRERLRRDPERRAAALARDRMNHKLRQERRLGYLPEGRDPRAVDAWRPIAGGNGGGRKLPVGPFAEWVGVVEARELCPVEQRARPDRDGLTEAELAEVLRVNERFLRSLRGREYATVTLDLAERAIQSYGCQVAVNGYGVVAGVEDLWPEASAR